MLRHTWATNFHGSGSGSRNDLMEQGGALIGSGRDVATVHRSNLCRCRRPAIRIAVKSSRAYLRR